MDKDDDKRVVTFIVLVVIITSFIMGIGTDKNGEGAENIIIT